MIAIARVVFAEEVDGNGGFITLKILDTSTLGELKEKVLQKVAARQKTDEQKLDPAKFSLLYLEGDGIAKAEEKTQVSWFLRSEASSMITFYLLAKDKDSPTPATRAYCLELMEEVLPSSARRKSPPRKDEVKGKPPPPPPPRSHSDTVITPRHKRNMSAFAPPKLFVGASLSPSHRRATSIPCSPGNLAPRTEIVDIPTPTTRTRSGRALHSPNTVPQQRWVAAQEPVSFGSLSLLSPHSRARERWSLAAHSVTHSNQPKTFADIVLESRRVRTPQRPAEGGFRELVVLLATMKRNKGVSEEQQYKLKSMMLSRDPEEVKRAKDFLEELDLYTESNEIVDASDNAVHTLYPHMNELDDVSKIIHTPKGYHYFFSFLESEYSQENLLFWRAVKDFERDFASDKPTSEIREHALRLWNNYIGPQAENMINLSSVTVKGFRDQLFSKSRFSTDLLFQACEDAKTDIERLLARDSFQRFKKSPLYAKLCENAQIYHTPQKREKRRGGSDLIRQFFGQGGDSA